MAADPLARYDDVFEAASKEWNVDLALLKAVARQESGGDPQARSTKNAHGLMQITPDTQKGLGITDPFDPVQSIFGGAKYLNEALEKEGRPDLALLYYHGGPKWRDAYGPESRAYVPAVSAHYAAYKASGSAPAAANANATPRPAAARPAAPAPAAPAPSVDDLHQAFGEPGGTTPKPGDTGKAGNASPSDEDLNAAFGPPAAATPKPAGDAGPRSGYLPDTWKPPQPGADRFGPLASDVAQQGFAKEQAADAAKSDDQRIREYLAPAPNTTYGSVLPYAKDDKTGDVRLAAPTFVRDFGQGIYDLTQGPATGTVTPEGTNALAGIMTGGLTSSPAAGTGKAIGGRLLQRGDNALGRTETPDLLGPEFRAAPTAPPTAEVPNPLAPSATGPSEPTPFMQPPSRVERLLYGPEAGVPAPASASPGGPSPGMGGPQPAGAQVTPAGAAAMTPEEVAAHRYTADKQWLMKSKPPGEADATEYIPGINPTAAQQEQTAVRAREMKTVRNLSPEVAQSERELLSHHNDKRKDFYAETAGSEVTRHADMTAAERKIEADLKTVWQNKGKADARPIIEAANTELDGSAGLLPPVRNVAKQVTDAVTNADGSLKTDPQQLYQARRLINYMQSKAGRAENPGYGSEDVQASLVRMKAAVDQVIEPAAPGFGKAISEYAQARGPIDAAETLQARENGLLDGQGRMQYSKVHNLLRDIIEAQKSPASPLAHVSEAQLTRLRALHDDLQRVASAEELARASGSDSVQNAADAAKALAKMGARGAAHAVANAVAPGVGSLAVESVLQGASRVWEPFRAARTERGLRRRGQELLYPPEPKGGRTPNALGPD